jgi:hypothetical protein
VTVKERARELAAAAPEIPDVEALLEEAIRSGLKDAAEALEAQADRVEKMYADIGMDGYNETRMRREAAKDLRERADGRR